MSNLTFKARPAFSPFDRNLDRTRLALTICLTVVALTGCAKPGGSDKPAGEMIKPEAAPIGFARADDSDPELIAAKVEAQKGLPEFKAAFAKHTADQKFAIKAPFREGRAEEHKWVIVDARAQR